MSKQEKSEIQKKVEQLQDELFQLRFDHAAGIVKDVSGFKKLRKQIARLRGQERIV